MKSARAKIKEDDSLLGGERELTPIGEKTGNPTFAVSKTAVSHFTIKRPRGASSKKLI